MTFCTHCNGIGYLSVRNGDDDIECPVCSGTGVRALTLPEALYTVSRVAHGVLMNYFTEYLPAILLVNETWPHEGRTIEDGEGTGGESWAEWKLSQTRVYEVRRGDGL